MRHNHKTMSAKVSKIMHEGVRGKKVGQKQAVAIAASMLGISKKKGRIKSIKSKKKK